MQTEIIIAGFGGQGILFAGTVLAYAAMKADRYVTWIPSYGPEMRGGTANVTVIISDENIGSPLVRHPDAALVLNNPSLEKYNLLIKPDGVLVYNSSMVTGQPDPHRNDVYYVSVPATEVATELGDVRMANMVGLGALVVATDVLPLTAVIDALGHELPADQPNLLKTNQQALQQGATFLGLVHA